MPPKAVAAGAHGLSANDINMLKCAAKCGANFTDSIDWDKFGELAHQKYTRNAKAALKKVVDKLKSLGEGEDDNGGGDDADGGAEAPAAKGKKVAAGKTGSPEKKATATKKAVGARKAPVKASNGMEPAKTGGKGGRKKTEPKTEEVKQEDAEASDEEKYGKSTTNHASGIEDDNNAPHWADVENAHARNMEYEEYMRATEAHGGWMTPPTPCRGNVSEEDA